MTSFLDGPAQGQTLMLQRAPYFLRVVQGHENGKEVWDALDQLTDIPRDKEALYVYRITAAPSRCHILHKDRRRSGWYVMAEYRFHEPQPDTMTARDTVAWQAWTRAQADELKKWEAMQS